MCTRGTSSYWKSPKGIQHTTSDGFHEGARLTLKYMNSFTTAVIPVNTLYNIIGHFKF